MSNKKYFLLDKIAFQITRWIGTPISIIVHTILFITLFFLVPLGISLGQILLILTTAVSLEAIYLAIFIQMTINRTTDSLEEVEENIDDIQSNVDTLEEDVQKINKGVREDDVSDAAIRKVMRDMTIQIKHLRDDLNILKKRRLQ